MANSTQFVTKDRLLILFNKWEVKAKPPTKKQKVVVVWPKYTNPNVATITVAVVKSTYGQTLYKIEFSMEE